MLFQACLPRKGSCGPADRSKVLFQACLPADRSKWLFQACLTGRQVHGNTEPDGDVPVVRRVPVAARRPAVLKIGAPAAAVQNTAQPGIRSRGVLVLRACLTGRQVRVRIVVPVGTPLKYIAVHVV